jgi:hypothetical protein
MMGLCCTFVLHLPSARQNEKPLILSNQGLPFNLVANQGLEPRTCGL